MIKKPTASDILPFLLSIVKFVSLQVQYLTSIMKMLSVGIRAVAVPAKIFLKYQIGKLLKTVN